jgi:TolB-like protein
MISLTAYLNKLVLIFVAVFFLLPTLAHSEEVGNDAPMVRKGRGRIAVYPVENLTGGTAPVKEIRKICIEKLKVLGVNVLEEEVLEKFMAKYRIRYTGGVNREIAKAFKQDIDVDGVFIVSLGLYSDIDPPKISLISRLVSTGEDPSILWMDGVGLAGDNSPGILGLGLIKDPNQLLDKALKTILDSLVSYLSGEPKGQVRWDVKNRFHPKVSYRSLALDSHRKYTVVIAPFFSISERKYAGEMMTLHFAKELMKVTNFHVIEPGVVRQTFVELRIVMEQGVSLANAELISGILNADLVVSGKVIDYQDYQGTWGKPKVSFTAQLIERRSQEVMWSSHSYNEGDDGVFFFDRGRVHTAHTLASEMIRWIGKMMVEDKERVQGVKGSRGRVR